ncbi:centrosomal protein of 192 kDa-like isoform X2 [Argopecten irradians]|uniref:centrosomal protein of 192 kDa-like isoform X2 n=1 Tax=Argopecten irradians TaxID=31199 RepID=UPI00371EC726
MDSKLSTSDVFSTSIEEQQFRPLAASTAARQAKPLLGQSVKGGSFLDVDDSTSLSTDFDLPPQEQLRLSFNPTPKTSPPEKKDNYAVSRNSSLGLVHLDSMTDLSASMFNLNTSPREPVAQPQPSSSRSSQSSSQTWLHPDIDTVKKKPTVMPMCEPVGEVRQSLVFSEALMGGDAADISVPEIKFMDDELNQLDADFSYFDEGNVSDSDAETPGKKNCGSTEDLAPFVASHQTKHLPRMESQDSCSEIDTEDELEIARKAIGQEEKERSRTMGQSLEQEPSESRPGLMEGEDLASSQQKFTMRQSAEGDVVTSPVPGDGGGGGDGSSGSDSEDQSRRCRSSQAQEFLAQFQPSFQSSQGKMVTSHDPEEQRVRPMGDDLLTEKGINRYSTFQGTKPQNDCVLESRFLTAQPTSDTMAMAPCSALNDSTFVLDDLQQSRAVTGKSQGITDQSPGDRLEASGFNADDANPKDDDPFGGLASSFGSFGTSPVPDRGSAGSSVWKEMHASPMSQRMSNDSRVPGSPQRTGEGDQSSFSKCDLQGEPAGGKGTLFRDDDLETPCGITFSDQDFLDAGEVQNMLDADEQENKKEHIFMQEEVFTSDDVPASDVSWTFRDNMSMSCPSSLQGSEDFSRISVGTFMKSRSGALGSIDGVPDQRPEFGFVCKTPPENRKPVALLDDRDESCVNRTAGVGNEEGDTTLVSQSEMTMAELAGSKTGDDTPQDQSASESSTTLNISQISKAIASMRSSATPEELVQIIMSLPKKKRGPSSSQAETMPASSQREETEGHSLSKAEDREPRVSTERKETEGESQQSPRDQLNKSRSKLPVRKGSTVDSKRRSQSFSDSARGSYDGEEVKQDEISIKPSQGNDFHMEKTIQKSKPDGEESEDEFSVTHASAKGRRVSDQDEGVASLPSDTQADKDLYRSPRLSMAFSRRSETQQESSVNPSKSLTFDEDAPHQGGPIVSLEGSQYQSRGKQPADGQASRMELYVQTTHTSSPCPLSSAGLPQNNFSKITQLSTDDAASRAPEKSPRSSSSTSLGLTGHHIPDGTEYSFQADIGNVSSRSRSREDLVGTADIQLADSRGFDLINNRELLHNNQNYKKQSSRPDLSGSDQGVVVEKQQAYPESDAYQQKSLSMQRNKGTANDTEELVDIHPDSFTQVSEMGPLFSQTKDSLFSSFKDRTSDRDRLNASEKLSTDVKEDIRPTSRLDSPVRRSNSRGGSGRIDSPVRGSNSRGVMESLSPPVMDNVSQGADQLKTVSQSSSRDLRNPAKDESERCNRMTSSPELSRNVLDSMAMPPPAIPSFRHDLLSKKPVAPSGSGEKPLLLTSQSLSTTDFAQEYLQRDIPGHLITNPLSSGSLHGRADTRGIPRPHFRDSNLDDISHRHLHQQTLHGLSTLDNGPVYQSTPFSKGNNSTQFFPIDELITTSSNMTMRMSTGSINDFTPVQHKRQESHARHSDTDGLVLSKKLQPVEAPLVLKFSSVCCVGISNNAVLPMTNPTSSWLECHIEVKSLSLDGHPVPCDTNFPFEMKSKVIIEPHNTEEMMVIFMPKYPGAYKAELNIYSHLFLREKDAGVNKVETFIKIVAEAEKPQIQVVADGHRHMDFGHLSWGSTCEKYLSIVNEGKAMVPIRLAITASKRPWHCFEFDSKNSAADVSVISRTSRPQTQALGKTVITMCLPGRRSGQLNQPWDVSIYCRPPEKHYDRAMAQLPPEEMMARVEMEVDTPSSHMPPLFSIKLSAIVGMAKLHIDRSLDVVRLMAPIGKQDSQKVSLKNVGNINMELMLYTATDGDELIVTPRRMIIPPGEKVESNIKFLPTKNALTEFETVLLMRVLPDGPEYELPVVVKVVKEQVNKTQTLLSDKHFLCYCGVPVGQYVQKRVNVMNKSDERCRIRMSIRSSSQDFQLQNGFDSEQQQMSNRSRDVILHPMEKYPIHIVYAPTSVCESTGKLCLKYSGSAHTFSIPLRGYGGTSKVIIEGAQVSEKDHYFLNMGEMSVGQRIVKRVTIRNIGDRAAYIRSVCCSDLQCKQFLVAGRVLVDPNEFVLGVQDTRTVVIMLNATHRESALCLDHKSMVGVVTFLYGDEISRQKLRRAVEHSKPVSTTEDVVLKTINFCNHYLDEEEYVPTDELVMAMQKDTDLFFSSMQRVKVSLIGEPAHVVETVTPAIHRPLRTLDLQSLEPRYNITQKRDSTSMRHTMPEMPAPVFYSETDKDHWALQPEQIILYVPNKRDEKLQIQKFVITNFLNRKMTYELSWPAHWIKITPEKGTVESKSSSTVCLSPSAAMFQSFDQLPWSGKILINCDNQYKELLVQIRNDLVLDGSSLVSNNTLVPLSATLPTPLAINGSHDMPAGLQALTTTITFPPTKVGEQSESYIDLINYSRHTTKWILSSFAPPYVKGADNSKDVFRATYKVFEFAEKRGQVVGHQEAKLQVQFIPRSKGMFSQHWDIQSSSEKPNKSNNTLRVQLCGEGLEKEGSGVPGTVSRDITSDTRSIVPTQRFSATADSFKSLSTTGKSSLSPKMESRSRSRSTRRSDKDQKLDRSNKDQKPDRPDKDHRPVVLKDHGSDIQFRSCRPNATVVCKINLKNESNTTHTIEIKQLSLPFSSKYTNITVRPRNYLRFPVEFSPQSVGHYTENLVLNVDLGYSLTIQLKGHCT